MDPPALCTTWFGAFLLSQGQVEASRLFPQSADQIQKRLTDIEQGRVLDEERDLAAQAGTVTAWPSRLHTLPQVEPGDPVSVRIPPEAYDVDPRLGKQAAILHAQSTVRAALGEKSRHLVQAVAFLDESHEMENRMGERLVAWYRLHAPAIVDRVEDHRELAERVAEHGTGEAIAQANDWPEGLIGSPIGAAEQDAMQALAHGILEQANAREPLERFIETVATELAPNVASLTTPAIAARLIHHAGGLKQLAMEPASTIQMLGAERAVFEHLTEGAPPPKHGVIFQHPLIHEAHPNDRGSIARAMAGKIAIAARADAFTGNDIASELRAELEARAEEVQRIGRRRAKKRREANQ